MKLYVRYGANQQRKIRQSKGGSWAGPWISPTLGVTLQGAPAEKIGTNAESGLKFYQNLVEKVNAKKIDIGLTPT